MTLPGPHLRMPNYLVERFMKLRLNATQWQIIWAVWRRTLCWQQPGQWGNSPKPIGTPELANACGINSHQVKREMGSLVKMNIILRDNTPGGRGHKPITAFNLDPSTWNVPVNSSEIATLNERVTDVIPITEQKGSDIVTPSPETTEERVTNPLPLTVADLLPFTDKSATLSLANSKLGKKRIKKPYKETPSSKEEGRHSPQLGPDTPASRYLFEQTGRKRWAFAVQKKEFEKAESEVGEARMKEAINWALTSGISNVKSIITAARKKHGQSRADTRPRGTDSDRRRDRAPTREQYQRSLES